jgi:hypothetical protein
VAKTGQPFFPGPFRPAKCQRTGARAPHSFHITTIWWECNIYFLTEFTAEYADRAEMGKGRISANFRIPYFAVLTAPGCTLAAGQVPKKRRANGRGNEPQTRLRQASAAA